MDRIPVHQQGHYLIATLQPELTDQVLVDLRRSLVESVGAVRPKGVLIDASRVDVVDSFAARIIRDIADMVRLRGTEAVVVGIQPAVAVTMVRQGLSLENVRTALDIEDGIGHIHGLGDAIVA